MTPFKILWHELLSMSTEHHCHISKPLPWESLCQIPDHSKHIPIAFPWRLHGWLAVQAHMLRSIFLIPFVTIVFFSHHILEFSPITVATIPFFVILWHICSKQPLHFSKSFTFPKCCCYFLPSKWQKSKNKQTKNIQYCVNKETTIICRLYGECDRCVKCFETSWPSQELTCRFSRFLSHCLSP